MSPMPVGVLAAVAVSALARRFRNLFPLQMVTASTRKKQVSRLIMVGAFNVLIFRDIYRGWGDGYIVCKFRRILPKIARVGRMK